MYLPDLSAPPLCDYSLLLCDSYRYWTSKDLVTTCDRNKTSIALFNAPFVLVSHGTEPVPVFNYANKQALELFEVDWQTFIKMPSRQSADMDNQSARVELMSRVREEGCVTGCSGIRITATGKRFRIDGATVWNVIDTNGKYHGQAAMFDQWSFL